jgi:septum site-determining protein MinD
MLSIDDVLEILSIPLLGVIPESKDILRASNIGAPVTINASGGSAGQAYLEEARRLGGETTAPVAIPDEKKTFFTRLFGRRAA